MFTVEKTCTKYSDLAWRTQPGEAESTSRRWLKTRKHTQLSHKLRNNSPAVLLWYILHCPCVRLAPATGRSASEIVWLQGGGCFLWYNWKGFSHSALSFTDGVKLLVSVYPLLTISYWKWRCYSSFFFTTMITSNKVNTKRKLKHLFTERVRVGGG